jgi:MFS family permease
VVSVASGLPMLLLSLIGGVVADRLPRRRVILASQAALGLGAAALAILTLAGLLQIWHLVALGAVQGTAIAFNMPARQAYIAEMVGPSLLRDAVALNNAGWNLARVVGPAVAGVLLAAPGVDIGGVFVGMAVIYGLVVMSVARLPEGRGGEAADARGHPGRGSGWSQLVEGLRYIRSSPIVRALLGMALLSTFFGMPYQTLLPLFSERVYAVGATGLGLMMAAIGVGALAGSLAVATFGRGFRPAVLQLGLGVGYGLALVGFALAPAFPLAVAALALVGFLSSGYMVLNNSLVMGNVEPRLYGRVMSVYLLTWAMMPFGAMPLAWLADQVGGRATVALAGLIVAGSIAAIALFYPPYRRIR